MGAYSLEVEASSSSQEKLLCLDYHFLEKKKRKKKLVWLFSHFALAVQFDASTGSCICCLSACRLTTGIDVTEDTLFFKDFFERVLQEFSLIQLPDCHPTFQ